jgi:hypothetical protein
MRAADQFPASDHLKNHVSEMEIGPGQTWELCSPGEDRWVQVVVTNVEDGRVTLRYQDAFEFITLDVVELQNPKRFRPTMGWLHVRPQVRNGAAGD